MAKFEGTTEKGINYIYDTKPNLTEDQFIERANAWNDFALGWIEKAKINGTLEDITKIERATKRLIEPFIYGNFNFSLEMFNKKYKNPRIASYALTSLVNSYNHHRDNEQTF